MMKRIILLLAWLLLLPVCAFAVTAVPDHVTAVEEEAFAGTHVDALIIPPTVEYVGARVLAGCSASYIYVQGAETALAAEAAADVPFVFGPAGGTASALPGFYAAESLVLEGDVYYAVTDAALPLCARAPFTLQGSVTIPKLLNGAPVRTLAVLDLSNTGVTEVRIPAYLTIPDGLNATPYATMHATAPMAEVSQSPAGQYVTWTTAVEGAYGAVSYLWTFTMGEETHTTITSEPSVRFAPMAEGECTVTVLAEDELGDRAASAASETLTVTAPERVYRAVLVANTYPGETKQLAGCDNDLAAMNAMLSSMSSTPFRISSGLNVTAGEIVSRIRTTFADAQPGDVSLFYYGGHGTPQGALVGVRDTILTAYSLSNALDAIPGTKIVILDCCYSGQLIGRSADSAAEDPAAFNSAIISAFAMQSRADGSLADEGYIVLTACAKDQQSMTVRDGAGMSFGAFTYGLCYASGYDEWHGTHMASMPGDADANGAISLSEAVAGVKERIAYLNTLMKNQLTQNVQSYGSGPYVLWRK